MLFKCCVNCVLVTLGLSQSADVYWDGLIRKNNIVEFHVEIFSWDLRSLCIRLNTLCTPNIETLIACSAVISFDCVNFDSF